MPPPNPPQKITPHTTTPNPTIQVLSSRLRPNDLVQFGGAAGLKAGETLAPPPPLEGQQEQQQGNGIVYRYVERQRKQAAAAATNKGKKRPAASAASSPASANDGGKRQRRVVEEEEEEEGERRLREEVKQLRAALVGATRGAEGVFKVGVCVGGVGVVVVVGGGDACMYVCMYEHPSFFWGGRA